MQKFYCIAKVKAIKKTERFRRRASIKPVIGHLKEDFGFKSIFLKGEIRNKIH